MVAHIYLIIGSCTALVGFLTQKVVYILKGRDIKIIIYLSIYLSIYMYVLSYKGIEHDRTNCSYMYFSIMHGASSVVSTAVRVYYHLA